MTILKIMFVVKKSLKLNHLKGMYMNNIKKISCYFVLLTVFANAQAGQVNSNLVAWTRNNVAEIAQRIAKNPAFFNKRNNILNQNALEKVLNVEEYMNYLDVVNKSDSNKAYVLGAIQAELDQSKLAFSGQSIPMENDEILQRKAEQNLRLWVQKNLNKLIKYFNNKQTMPSSFDEFVEACKSLKIQMPLVLDSVAKQYLLDEIITGLDLINVNGMSESQFNNLLTKIFDKKQIDYLEEDLLPKITASGIEKVSIDSLIRYLENLPNKSFVGQKFLNNLIKSHLKIQMEVVESINNYLTKVKILSNVVEVVQQLKHFEPFLLPLKKDLGQNQKLENIVEVVKQLFMSKLQKIEKKIAMMSIKNLLDIKPEMERKLKNSKDLLDQLVFKKIFGMIEQRLNLDLD